MLAVKTDQKGTKSHGILLRTYSEILTSFRGSKRIYVKLIHLPCHYGQFLWFISSQGSQKSSYPLNLTSTKHFVQLRRILFINTKFD